MPKMVVFIEADGNRKQVEAPEGLSILLRSAAAQRRGHRGGLRGLARLRDLSRDRRSDDWYRQASKRPSEDEEDMLDLAFGLTRTSRLGCQITVTEAMDGLTVRLPDSTRNLLLEE